MIRDDDLLGPVRLCVGCDEEWPWDPEFWHLRGGRFNTSYPHRCIACCADYYAARRRLTQTVARHEYRAERPIEGRCNTVMRGRAMCGRWANHRNEHRSQDAMSHATAAHRRAA